MIVILTYMYMKEENPTINEGKAVVFPRSKRQYYDSLV